MQRFICRDVLLWRVLDVGYAGYVDFGFGV